MPRARTLRCDSVCTNSATSRRLIGDRNGNCDSVASSIVSITTSLRCPRGGEKYARRKSSRSSAPCRSSATCRVPNHARPVASTHKPKQASNQGRALACASLRDYARTRTRATVGTNHKAPSMITTVAGGVSQSGLRRLLVCGASLASMVVWLERPATAQTNCDDAIVEPSVESIDRLLEVADCHRATGRLDRAVTLLEAAASNEDGSTFVETIAIHGRLGQLHAARGDYTRAIEHLLLAIDTAPAADAPPEAAALLNDLGGAYMANDQSLLGLAGSPTAHASAAAGSAVEVTAIVNAVRALHGGRSGATCRRTARRARTSALALPPTPSKASLLLALAELYREIDQRRRRADTWRSQRRRWRSRRIAAIRRSSRRRTARWAPRVRPQTTTRRRCGTRAKQCYSADADLRDSRYRYE